jgi:hypothetical protein
MRKRLGLAAAGNSDAHILWMIGIAATRFSGSEAAHLEAALRNHTTSTLVAKRSEFYVASYLKRQLLRLCGLAQWSSATPGGPIGLRRLSALTH